MGHKGFQFRALGFRKVYFLATLWHTPSLQSEYTKILQLSKDLFERPLSPFATPSSQKLAVKFLFSSWAAKKSAEKLSRWERMSCTCPNSPAKSSMTQSSVWITSAPLWY